MPAEYGSLTTFLPPLDDSPAPPASSDRAMRSREECRAASGCPSGGERSGDAAAAPRPGEKGAPATAGRRPARSGGGGPGRRRRRATGPSPRPTVRRRRADGGPVWAPPAAAGVAGCGQRAWPWRRWRGRAPCSLPLPRFTRTELACRRSGQEDRHPPDRARGCRPRDGHGAGDGGRRVGLGAGVRRHRGGPGEPRRGRQRHSGRPGWGGDSAGAVAGRSTGRAGRRGQGWPAAETAAARLTEARRGLRPRPLERSAAVGAAGVAGAEIGGRLGAPAHPDGVAAPTRSEVPVQADGAGS